MTSISVLLLSTDAVYCNRVVGYLNKFHSDIKISVLHSDEDIDDIISKKRYSIFLIDDEFAADTRYIPSNVACMYFTDYESGIKINDRPSICKYKSGETIYKTILSLFSEVSSVGSFGKEGSKVISFFGANGGSGASSAAAALAYRVALKGKNVLYLNLDKFADPVLLFEDHTESGNLSDLIYFVKTNSKDNVNLSSKSTSLLKKDISGVRFIDNCQNPCDFDEVDIGMLSDMVSAMRSSQDFDAIIIDGQINEKIVWQLMCRISDDIIIVTQDTLQESIKLSRILNYIKVEDVHNSTDIFGSISIIVNKNIQQSSNLSNYSDMVIGNIPYYKDNNVRNIANAISRLEWWDSIV